MNKLQKFSVLMLLISCICYGYYLTTISPGIMSLITFGCICVSTTLYIIGCKLK